MPRITILRVVLRAFLIPTLVATAGCATTGATYRSGVADAFLEHPPYYAGSGLAQLRTDSLRIGHLPIAYQRGASQEAFFDPKAGEGSAVAQLLGEMNAYLDSLAASGARSVRMLPGNGAAAAVVGTPPNVIFGCITETGAPDGDCAERTDGLPGRRGQRMRLAVGRPSQEWIDWHRTVASEQQVGRTLVLTLEVGQYLMKQRGLLGTKEVELGTNYTMKLPWLTSVETPVTVLQLTGALVGEDGLAVRIGAEGIMARRTALLVSAIGAQEILTEKDVEQVRTLRREDLPGNPLAWQVALTHLVAQLTGRTGSP